ncbi:MAG: hypothetical protein ABIG39_03300 [Candidatus Micrarchaeota archaeon]
MVTREEILGKGVIELRVSRSGMLQNEEFVVKRIDSAFGKYVALEVNKYIDLKELIRISEDYHLPVFAKNGRIFPKGTSTKDFVGL